METPQEKAKKLISINSVTILSEIGSKLTMYEVKQIAKQCALIAVDEIAKCTKYEKQKFDNDRFSEDYWQEVKEELEQSK
jgi:hypothetical protein